MKRSREETEGAKTTMTTTTTTSSGACPAPLRACVAVHENQVADHLLRTEDTRILNRDEEIDRVRQTLRAIHDDNASKLFAALAATDEESISHYKSIYARLMNGEWRGIANASIDHKSIPCIYSQIELSATIPNPTDGAYGPYDEPLRGMHAVARRTPNNTSILRIDLLASNRDRRGAVLTMPLDDKNTVEIRREHAIHAPNEQLRTQALYTHMTVAALSAPLRPLLTKQPPSTLMVSDNDEWGGVHSFDSRVDGHTFEQPRFVAAAMSRFATSLGVPVLLNAGRLMRCNGKVPDNFVPWRVTPIDMVTLTHMSDARAKNRCMKRQVFLKALFHKTCVRCICPLFRGLPRERSVGDHGTCELTIRACGAPVINGRCSRNPEHACSRSTTCVDDVAVVVQCLHSSKGRDSASSSAYHTILLNESERVYAQALVRNAIKTQECCQQQKGEKAESSSRVFAADETNDRLRNHFRTIEAQLRAAEAKQRSPCPCVPPFTEADDL